jgi:hypothetical protein
LAERIEGLKSHVREQYVTLQTLRKDAERYRWLRDSADCDEGVAPMVQMQSDWGKFYWSQVKCESLNAAIDEAIGEKA